MAIYRGLNVAKALSDIDDSREALKNLGLNREDFDLIAGLTSADVGVGIQDFHNMSGLREDQKKILESLAEASDATESRLEEIEDIGNPLRFNFKLDNNKLVGGAIKYQYLDFNNTDSNNLWEVKAADISTSRASSWSPVGAAPNQDDYILYGGDIKVRGDKLAFTKLSTTEAPLPKSFRSEVATHVLRANIGDTGEESLYLMKGIPLEWEGIFEAISLRASVTPISDAEGNIPITWRITNLSAPVGSYNSGDGSNNTASIGTGNGNVNTPVTYSITPPGYIRRKIEFFYDPSKVLRLELDYANIRQWTNVSLPNIKWLNISHNDFSVIPEFRADGTVAKQGFDGGAGLATKLERLFITGNNLGRANSNLEGSDRSNTGLSSQQVNRLPTTLTHLYVNGCFTDNTTLDLTDYENLVYLDAGSNYTRELRRQQSAVTSPSTYNPKKRVFFSTDSSEYETAKLSNRLYASAHGFTTNGTPVQYDYHVDIYARMGEPIAGLTAGTTFYVRVITSNTLEIYTTAAYAQNTASITGRISLSGSGGANHGKLHSLTQWDITTNAPYMASTTKGIQTYRIYNQSYRELSPGVYNSKTLYFFYGDATPITTNSETPYYSNTASIGGTITPSASVIKSSKDMAIPKFEATTTLRYFYSQFNPHNIVDCSGNTSIYRYYHWKGVIDSRYQEAETTINGKFNGCTSLTHLLLYNQYRTSGNFEVSNTFQNMPNLQYANLLVWGTGGAKGRIYDTMFSGSTKLRDFTVGGSQLNEYTSDILGTSGQGGIGTIYSGKALSNGAINMYAFRVAANHYGSGTFVAEEAGTYDFQWPTNDSMRTLYFYGNNLRGTLPNLFISFKFLSMLHIGYQTIWMRTYKAQEKQIYKITNTDHTTFNTGQPKRLTTNDYKAIGWIANQSEADNKSICGDVFGNSSGNTPGLSDAFIMRHIPIATGNPNSYLRPRFYRIMKLGNTDWNAITTGGNTNPYLGQKIAYNDAVITAAISTGEGDQTAPVPGTVIPWSDYASVRSLGLTGTFPTFATQMSNLRHMYIYRNNFTGQCPKVDAPKLLRWYGYHNSFSGSIPDYSSCRSIQTIRGYDNKFSTHTLGNLANAVRLTQFDFRNNVLEASCLRDLLLDLVENYNQRNRSGVTINLVGQSGTNRLRESSKFDGSGGPNSTKNLLEFLRGVAGWSILLDS